MRTALLAQFVAILLFSAAPLFAAETDPLAVGIAGHAFDHLGSIGEQADAAAESGANIIYATGVGGAGYAGLPPAGQLAELSRKNAEYVKRAKAKGVRIALGYVCATSIVNLQRFDKNWSKEFRAQFATTPDQWLQAGRDGKPLKSWYAGQYEPACMNNPDWRAYQKAIVKLQLDAGHDGIFFDNPTVHPQGCYCQHCMKRFAATLAREEKDLKLTEPESADALRQLPAKYPEQFLRFRASIAADFLSDIRTFARTINPKALITCNNSLNAPEAFYSQCRTHAYNIHAMSQAEDLVVVEDQANQPRTLADGRTIEYGHVYEMLHAISHGKPLVAVTIADGDYHTPPNLVRLAMAEAAAHRASYLSWPTWPEAQRQKMIAAARPQADLLRAHADLLNDTERVSDVAVYLPFSRWLQTDACQSLTVSHALSRNNVQFIVLSEDSLQGILDRGAPRLLIVESPAVLDTAQKAIVDKFTAAGGRVIWSEKKTWPADFQAAMPHPSVVVQGPATVRAVAHRKAGKTIVHLLNLNITRLSSFEDRITLAADVKLQIRCRGGPPKTAEVLTADEGATRGRIAFHVVAKDQDGAIVEVTVPSLSVAAMVVLE